MTTKTIFQSLRLAVLSVENGVYHLQRRDEANQSQGDVVGLLFAEAPVRPGRQTVKLFMQDVQGVPTARVIYHWQTLDARRFEESGLEPLEVELSDEQIAGLTDQRYTRPDGVRLRYAVRLGTGEVICYN